MTRSLVVLALPVLAATGCGGMTLQMTPITPAYIDESSISPSLQIGSFKRIMIVPPSGSAGVEFQENMAAVERAFIARGITVISSAITSRVILRDETGDRQRAESGLSLTEVERALLLARESNADAVLQIGSWDWVQGGRTEHGRRYYVKDKGVDILREVQEIEFEEAELKELFRHTMGGDVLAFTGRLINVESGEVLASFKLDVPRVNVYDPLTIRFKRNGEIEAMSYDPDRDERRHQASGERVVAALFDRLALLLAQGG